MRKLLLSGSRWNWLLDSVAVFALAVVLIAPLFRLKYMDNWASIESTFISDGRFLLENWPHPGWHPLWYCGTRFDYIYPPALRYGTAWVSKTLGVIPAKGYHIYTAFFYCFGIAGVYLFLRIGAGSRGVGWLGALAAATLSPAVALIGHMRVDAAGAYSLPQRLNVLIRYGEGPHMTAFAWLGPALAAAWLALPKWRPGALALAGVFSALAVSNNFYGATALAIFYPLLVWSLWLAQPETKLVARAAAIPMLACGLTAFWLTPSYLRVTLDNMKLVSEPGNRWSLVAAIAVAAVFAAATWRAGRRRPPRAWAVFVWGAFVFMTLNVLGNEYLGFRVIGEPLRLVPELDLVYILFALLGLAWLWKLRLDKRPGWVRRLPRLVAVLLVVLAFREARHYIRHAWELYPRDWHPENRIEYRITDWVAKNLPGSRVFAAGSTRFWYNAWHSLPQVGGGSEQGVLNLASVVAQWMVTGDPNPELPIAWLQAVGADAVIVHDERSQEIYHDFPHPRKFAGRLPVLYDSGEGDVIYRVPRRYPGLARVVETRRLDAVPPFSTQPTNESVRPYADAVEQGPDRRVRWRREGTRVMHVSGTLGEGESFLVQESYDPYWRAYGEGRRLPVRKDPMGFLLIEAPPGGHDIRLVFELPLENLLGRILSAAAGAAVIALFVLALAKRPAQAVEEKREPERTLD